MKWSEAKNELQKQDKRELIKFLKTLFELSPENRSFFGASLRSGGDQSLKHYMDQISNSLNPDIDFRCDVRQARKAITSYKKAAPDDLWGRVELMLHFVESGAYVVLDHGESDGRFVDSLCGMLDATTKLAPNLSGTERTHLAKRLEDLYANADNIGWGFSDAIADAQVELNSVINENPQMH